jgi:NAD(P)-dependent dehydrogenase (short-subunit alcohol dehydrogenase family)
MSSSAPRSAMVTGEESALVSTARAGLPKCGRRNSPLAWASSVRKARAGIRSTGLPWRRNRRVVQAKARGTACRGGRPAAGLPEMETASRTPIPADSLRGKVALVTGGGSGMGQATAILLASAGARVGVLDRAAEGIARTMATITGAGGQAVELLADVSDPAQVTAAAEKIEATWGRLDIVFANAGINGLWAPLEDITPEEWDLTFNVNLKGTFLTVRACTPLLKRSGGGSIIITASGTGTRMFSATGATAYATSKAGQMAFGRMVALELAPHQIRVNTICPGSIRTPLNVGSRTKNMEKLRKPLGFPEGSVPLTHGLCGEPEQVARLAWFLASDLSDHITGTEIYIDGAQSLLMG